MISASELKISKQTVYIKRKGTASVVRVNEFKLVNALNSYQDWTALLYAAHLKVTSHHPIYQAPTPILVPDEHQTPAELPPPPADKQDRKVTSIFGTESIFKDKLGALERFKKAIRIIDEEGGDIDKQIDGNDSLASFIQEARNELSDWKNNHKELLSSMDGVITPVEKIKTAKKKETKIKMSWADLYRKFLTSEAVIKIDLGNRFWPDALHHVYTSGIKNSFYDQFVLETQAGLPVKFYPQSTFNLEINDGYEDLNGFIGPAFLDGKRAVQPIVYGDGMKARTLGKFMNMDASREIIIKDPHSDKGFSSKTLWINSEFNSLIETLEKTRLGNPSQVAIAKDFISPLKELEEILKEVFIEELKSLKPAYPIAPQATLKKIVSDLEAELRSKAAIGGARLTGIPESPLSDSELKAALEFLRSDLQDHWIGKANLFWSSKGYGITINDAILKVVDPSYQTPVAVSQELKTIVTTSGIFEKDADGLAYAPRVRRVGARLGYQNILLVTKPVSGITEAEKIDNYLKEYPAASVFGYIKFGQAKKVSDLKQICSNFLTNEFILIAKEEEAITASNLDTQKLLELDPRADSTINILEEAANLLAGSAITKAAQKTTNGWTLWPKASKEYLKLIELVKQAKEVIGVAA